MRKTDHRNRNLVQFHRDVCFKKAGKQVIWQPRIACWIDDKKFANQKLPPPYENMTKAEIYRELGCSARIYEYNQSFEPVEPDTVHRYDRPLTLNQTEHVIETPVGKLTLVTEKTASAPIGMQRKWWMENEDDFRVAIWLKEHTHWRWNEENFQKVKREWGDLGAPTIYMPRTTLQDLYINTMGVENAVYALIDCPDMVKAYFQALDACHLRMIEVINRSPIEIINFGDNVHCGTLPPAYFEKYVLPSYVQRCSLLHQGGKFVHAHWDGDTKALLKYAKACGLDGLEAVTPLPQGDVTLAEIKAHLGDDLFLLDGIPAVLFDPVYSLAQLEDMTLRLIELFAGRLILGISDEISSTGDIERIQFVGKIVDDYNASLSSGDGG